MDTITKYSKRVSRSIILFKFISLFIFLLLIYNLISVLSRSVLRLENLFLLLRLIKTAFFALITLFFTVILLASRGGNAHQVTIRILESIFFSNPSTVALPTLLQKLETVVGGVIILILILVTLYAFGFIKTGEFEYVLWSFLLVLIGLLLGITFLHTQLNLPQLRSDNFSLLFSSSLFRFLIILYFFLVIGRQLSYFSTVLVPLSKRVQRISSKITMMESLGKEEEVKTDKRLSEEKGMVEQLSSISMTLRDAYQGYSFAGRGSHQFVSSKLKSFVNSQEEKKPDVLDSLAGKASLPSLKKYFFLSFFSFIMEVALSFPIGIFALMAPSIMQGFFPNIFIIGEYEFTVFLLMTFSLTFFLFVEGIEKILKKEE